MNDKKKVSIAVVKRLPRYYRYLADLLWNDITRISSKELSVRMGITASQIRQDLNCFGGFGQQGYGYNVEYLYNEIGYILGLHNRFRTIIVGAGNIGHALANYTNLERRGFVLTGIFDVSPQIVGTKVKDMEVLHFDKIEEFVANNRVDIAILSVPSAHTPTVAEKLANLGIKALWNFSAMELELSQDVIIENVHLTDSLMVLSYKLNQRLEAEKAKEKENEKGKK